MPKLPLLVVLSVIIFALSCTGSALARTTPEDLVNQQRQTYNNRVQNYSAENKQKLETFEKKVAALNKEKTDYLEQLMLRQGEILDEFIARKGITERQADGINRNLGEPVENARYWITYAHEAVAYQAAKIYIFNLTSEQNINRDILNTIASEQADLNALRSKVIKSQKILSELVK